MKRYIGRRASVQRKADEQLQREREWVKAQPLQVRRALKAERDALSAMGIAVLAGADRDALVALRREYDAAIAKTKRLIEEARHVDVNH